MSILVPGDIVYHVATGRVGTVTQTRVKKWWNWGAAAKVRFSGDRKPLWIPLDVLSRLPPP